MASCCWFWAPGYSPWSSGFSIPFLFSYGFDEAAQSLLSVFSSLSYLLSMSESLLFSSVYMYLIFSFFEEMSVAVQLVAQAP